MPRSSGSVVYRIAPRKFVRNLDGSGARMYGGRWNMRGTPMVYASEQRSLAALEFLVHTPITTVPANLMIVAITIPGTCSVETLEPRSLPRTWRDYPAPEKLADLGSKWINEGRSLVLRVPSVVVPQEFNTLLNPTHRDFSQVTVSQPERFALDARLYRSTKTT